MARGMGDSHFNISQFSRVCVDVGFPQFSRTSHGMKESEKIIK